MSIFDFLKKQKIGSISTKNVYKHDFTVADFQWDFVNSEIEKLEYLLSRNEYTKHLYFDKSIFSKNDCGFRFRPFTEKTLKISKYPCILDIRSYPANYAKKQFIIYYGASLYYDINDHIGKGQMFVHTQQHAYTIDLKNINHTLTITKIILTDKNLDNHKLYHLQKDGTVFKAK